MPNFKIQHNFYFIATDVDEYITAESVDYDPISDDELDALIEEPEETVLKTLIEPEKSSKCFDVTVLWF